MRSPRPRRFRLRGSRTRGRSSTPSRTRRRAPTVPGSPRCARTRSRRLPGPAATRAPRARRRRARGPRPPRALDDAAPPPPPRPSRMAPRDVPERATSSGPWATHASGVRSRARVGSSASASTAWLAPPRRRSPPRSRPNLRVGERHAPRARPENKPPRGRRTRGARAMRTGTVTVAREKRMRLRGTPRRDAEARRKRHPERVARAGRSEVPPAESPARGGEAQNVRGDALQTQHRAVAVGAAELQISAARLVPLHRGRLLLVPGETTTVCGSAGGVGRARVLAAPIAVERQARRFPLDVLDAPDVHGAQVGGGGDGVVVPRHPAHSAVIRPPWLAYVSLDRNDTSRSSLAQSQSYTRRRRRRRRKITHPCARRQRPHRRACSARCATKTPRAPKSPERPARTNPRVPEPADAARLIRVRPGPGRARGRRLPGDEVEALRHRRRKRIRHRLGSLLGGAGPFSGPSDERASPYPSGW